MKITLLLLAIFIFFTQNHVAAQSNNTLVKNDEYIIKPVPPGGENAFRNYIYENLTYPEEAKKHNIKGRVYLQFTVTQEGEIKDIYVIKGLGYGCDGEAVRLLKGSGLWAPARIAGNKKDMKMLYTIEFH
ncbi:MAG: energy transducer TonB [Cytophagaceae bacterium]